MMARKSAELERHTGVTGDLGSSGWLWVEGRLTRVVSRHVKTLHGTRSREEINRHELLT